MVLCICNWEWTPTIQPNLIRSLCSQNKCSSTVWPFTAVAKCDMPFRTARLQMASNQIRAPVTCPHHPALVSQQGEGEEQGRDELGGDKRVTRTGKGWHWCLWLYSWHRFKLTHSVASAYAPLSRRPLGPETPLQDNSAYNCIAAGS